MDRINSDWLLEFLDEWDAGLDARDAARVVALCAPDVVLDESGSDPLVGRADVEELLRSLYSRQAERRHERIGVFVSEDATSAAITYRTWVRYESEESTRVIDSVDILRFRDGLVAHWTAFLRNADWMGGEPG